MKGSRRFLTNSPPQPFWLEDANTYHYLPQPSLVGRQRYEVAIVGGGYTGLWTAIQLKLAQPSIRIALVERKMCGAEASGRNGGCMLTWSSKWLTLQRLFGPSEAKRLVQASESAVTDIDHFCREHNIDADIQINGCLYFASNVSQRGAMSSVIHQLELQTLNGWQAFPNEVTQQKTGVCTAQDGWFNPQAGTVHPAKLVNGLKRTALSLGVDIFENTALVQLHPTLKTLHTESRDGQSGHLQADKVVLAMGAASAEQMPIFRRSVLLVSSDMIISRQNVELTKHISSGLACVDNNTFVHYFRTTKDQRLMLGKGGNRFSYGNVMHTFFDAPSQMQATLESRALEFFRKSVDWETSWTGASDRTVTGLPFFGELNNNPDILYGLGYSGNGIVQSYLGGKILRSMTLQTNDEWRQCGLAQGPHGQFPVDPIRTFGAMMVRSAIRQQESKQYRDEPVPLWIKKMASLADAAGKTDKGTV